MPARPPPVFRRRAPFALVLSVLAACACPPAPDYLTPPLLRTGVTCYGGTPLTGPRVGAAPEWPEASEQALEVELRIHYVEAMPEAALAPLPGRLAVVFAEREGKPIRPVSRVPNESRIGNDAVAAAWVADELPALRSVKMTERRAALVPGTTDQFSVTSLDAVVDSVFGPVRKNVMLRVGRALGEDGAISVAVIGEDVIARPDELAGAAPETMLPVPPPEPDPIATDPPVRYRELQLLVDRPEVDGAPMVLLFPSPFVGYDGAFAMTLRVRSGAQAAPGHGDRLAHARAEVEAAEREGVLRSSRAGPDDLEAQAVASAWSSLATASTRRGALVWLSRGADAELSVELAMVARDENLARWWELAREEGAVPKTVIDAGWRLERAAYRLFVQTINEEDLSLAAEGALVDHTGAVGRLAAVLEDLVDRCDSLASLRIELLVENVLLLRNSNPAVRVRAFDWLGARGAAPDGYDPLGPSAERRKALATSLDQLRKLVEEEPK